MGAGVCHSAGTRTLLPDGVGTARQIQSDAAADPFEPVLGATQELCARSRDLRDHLRCRVAGRGQEADIARNLRGGQDSKR